MTTLHNEVIINAPIEKIWEALSVIDNLEKFDPTVKNSKAITSNKTGLDAKRKVDMLDGKNWFEEKLTEYKPNESLKFELTNCSFPINALSHSYSFERMGNQTKVKQMMRYSVKFGLFGKLLDLLMIRKQTNNGIQKFLIGLKNYTENK